MSSIAERFASNITLEYSLIDRMRVRGHVMNIQNITMLRTYFQRVRGVNWIEPRDLQQATEEFVRHVEAFAQQNKIPLLTARPGESHVDQAASYLDAVRGKGLIRKLDRSTRYVLTPEGMVQGTALAKLNECLNGTLGQPVEDEKVRSPQTDLQKCYRQVRKALRRTLDAAGLAAA
jgi:hypothetical protein